MMRLWFENEQGRLLLHGGPDSLYRTIRIQGLGYPVREDRVVRYAAMRGQCLLSTVDLARTITLCGDLQTPSRLGEMIRILYHPGVLHIQSRNRRRKIACRCTAFDDPEQKGPLMRFVVVFTCDDPAFADADKTVVPIYQVTNLLPGQFDLSQGPQVFSRRTNQAVVSNRGDLVCNPVVTVCNNQSFSWEPSDGIVLENKTTGSRLVISYALGPYETVTVDVGRRTIVNQDGDDLIACLGQSSFLSDFVLERGDNLVAATTLCQGTLYQPTVTCSHENLYIEAVLS